MKSQILSGTTDGTGAATVTASRPMYGLLHSIELEISNLDATADVTISFTSGDSGNSVTLLTSTNSNTDAIKRPRELEHDNVGANLATYAQPIVNGKVQAVVAQGGATNTFKVVVHVEEDG